MNDDTQSGLRSWLRQILEQTGWSPTRLAREANVSHTTITRMLDTDYSGSMTATTIAKIARATGIPASGSLRAAVPAGFAEPEVEPIEQPGAALTPDQSRWSIRGHSLELAGYLPGDQVIIDMSVAPRVNDVVIAQLYEPDTATAQTVLRLYQPPFLVTAATPEHGARPEAVDDETVRIMGVVIRMWRERPPD